MTERSALASFLQLEGHRGAQRLLEVYDDRGPQQECLDATTNIYDFKIDLVHGTVWIYNDIDPDDKQQLALPEFLRVLRACVENQPG